VDHGEEGMAIPSWEIAVDIISDLKTAGTTITGETGKTDLEDLVTLLLVTHGNKFRTKASVSDGTPVAIPT